MTHRETALDVVAVVLEQVLLRREKSLSEDVPSFMLNSC